MTAVDAIFGTTIDVTPKNRGWCAPQVLPGSAKAARRLGVAIAILVMTMPSAARAEPVLPSDLVPSTLRPAARPAEPKVEVAVPAVAPYPAGADRLDVVIDHVSIDGAMPALSVATDRILADVTGKRVTVARLYAVAAAIEQVYSRAGYVLSRVGIPPQKLVDHGGLRMRVVDGFIEAVDVTGVPERARAVVASRLASLVRRPHVTLATIERALLVAADVPGLQLRSTVARGKSEGGATLVIEGEHRLISGSLGGDDRLDRSLGTWQLRASLAVNDALGIGEEVYGTIGSGFDLAAAAAGTSPLSIYGVGAIVPVGTDGITLNPEYTRSTSRTSASPGVAASLGTFDRYAVSVSDPLILTRHEALTLRLSAEYLTQSAAAPDFDVTLNKDRYGVVRGGPEYTATLPWGAQVQGGITLSRGLGGRDQADGLASGIPLSRITAEPNFTKAGVNARIAQPLTDSLHVDVIAAAQTSFGKAILRPEQFALDGLDGLSSFAAGTFSVDQGATLRGELVRSLNARLGDIDATLSPYAFAAGGRGQVVDPTAVEQATVDAASVGIGIRGGVAVLSSPIGNSFGLEVGRRYSDVPGMRRGWRYGVISASTF